MDITSRSNPKIKYIRSLHQKKRREQHSVFLVEGQKLITEALDANLNLESLVCIEGIPLFFTPPPDLPIYYVPADLMASLSSQPSPPDFLAVASYFETPQILNPGLHLLTENIQDPGNFGALVRLCRAMGVQQIWALGSHVDKYHPKVIRGSMGAVFAMPLQFVSGFDELSPLKEKGWQFVSTLLSEEAHNSFEFQFTNKTCLILGNEGHGLTSEAMEFADLSLKIPLAHAFESLNVTTSAAMLIHEYMRQEFHK